MIRNDASYDRKQHAQITTHITCASHITVIIIPLVSHYVYSIALWFPTVDIYMYVSALWLSEAGLDLLCIYLIGSVSLSLIYMCMQITAVWVYVYCVAIDRYWESPCSQYSRSYYTCMHTYPQATVQHKTKNTICVFGWKQSKKNSIWSPSTNKLFRWPAKIDSMANQTALLTGI